MVEFLWLKPQKIMVIRSVTIKEMVATYLLTNREFDLIKGVDGAPWLSGFWFFIISGGTKSVQWLRVLLYHKKQANRMGLYKSRLVAIPICR
ncbi:MAG: hypothetical protein LC633_02795, partial [Desulfobulbaceae bacterium]|nr:hypothetical protein [Desulfobulbaceae bacterium]